jgi:hypothetical protein
MDGIISEWMNERMNNSSYVHSKPRHSAESSYTEDNCALIGYYAACRGDSLTTFLENL